MVKITKDIKTDSGIGVYLIKDGSTYCSHWFVKLTFDDFDNFHNKFKSFSEKITEKQYNKIKNKIMAFKNFE